ncbi:exportin-5-like protein, partial [Dinothrombium tinctorium]
NMNPILEYIQDCLICGDNDLCASGLRTLTGFLEWYPLNTGNKYLLNELLVNQILIAIPTKLLKQNFDLRYLGFEFDGSDDYEVFYYKFRAEILEFLRGLAALHEEICFRFCVNALKNVIESVKSSQQDWEIVAQILDAICNKITSIEKFSSDGLFILKHLLFLIPRSNDPDTISSQLSCLSALFVFLPYLTEINLLQELLNKIFTLALFNIEGQTKQTRTKAVKNLRRHACCDFLKLSRIYGMLLLPIFPELKSHINTISISNDELSQMEKCTLNEGLFLISNNFCDISEQQKLVHDIINTLDGFFNFEFSTERLISYTGLNLNMMESDALGQNRANLIYFVNSVVGLLKRINRKAALQPSIYPLLHTLLGIASSLNTLWKPEHQLLVHEDYRSFVFSLVTEIEKLQLLEISLTSNSANGIINKTVPHRMQTFLWSLHESCFLAFNAALPLLSPDIYFQNFNFSQALTDCEHLPDSKLRVILKLLVKPIIINCPNDQALFDHVIYNLTKSFVPFLFRSINSKWEAKKMRNLEEDGIEDKEMVESELIEDQLLRLLSREFVEFMAIIFIKSKNKNFYNNVSEDTEMADEEYNSNSFQEAVFSPLGIFLLQRMPDVFIIANAVLMTWLDSIVSYKSAVINSILFKQLISENFIKTSEEAIFLFQQVLTALSFFGEHEQNQSILLQLMLILYEGLVFQLKIMGVKEKLSEITGQKIDNWDALEEKWAKMAASGRASNLDKKKKESLKALLKSVIGKNIGQLYRRNIDEIRNLRPIIFSRRKHEIELEQIDLCKLFDI